MGLYKLSKVLPKRKYAIVESTSRWSTTFLGIYEIEIDGSPIIIENIESTSKDYSKYTPIEVVPVRDSVLNGVGVYNLLFVENGTRDFSIDMNKIKNSEWFLSYKRENSIDGILK